jgi:uncharacterized protein YndB with AHSA1/START domain
MKGRIMKLVKAAEATTVIDAPKDKVWRRLTTPASVKAFFFGADLKTTWKVGDPIEFSGDFKGRPYKDTGVVKTFTPGKELSFTHWSELSGEADALENHHLITITLKAQNGHTEVTLTQQNQDGNPVKDETRSHLETNWKQVLAGLKKVAEKE